MSSVIGSWGGCGRGYCDVKSRSAPPHFGPSRLEDARVKIETARQKLFALSLTAEQIEALPQQPVETLRRQELRAPIAGRVAERRVELGSLVGREGQESELFVIADLSVVWADLSVSPSDL